MKKIVLLTGFLFVLIVGSQGQIDQGKMTLGLSSSFGIANLSTDFMSFGFSTIKEKSDAEGFEEEDPSKMTRFNFSPRVGYAVAEKLVFGLDISTSFTSQKMSDILEKYSQNLVAVGPFFRYYFPSSNVLPFAEMSAQFGSIKEKYEYGEETYYSFEDEEYTSGLTTLGGGLGVAAPLGEKVHLDVLAGYTSLRIKDKEDNEDNDRSVVGTVSVKLGFTIVIGSN